MGLFSFEVTIDLLPELDVNPLPNLGPKVNHHFNFNNSAYIETEHPRWGYIQSVTPWNMKEVMGYSLWKTEKLKAGEELFTYYGYKQNTFPEDFPWYWETKGQILREERLKKEAKALEKWKKSKNNSKTQKKNNSKNCPKE